jgi:hypothetical protein
MSDASLYGQQTQAGPRRVPNLPQLAMMRSLEHPLLMTMTFDLCARLAFSPSAEPRL